LAPLISKSDRAEEGSVPVKVERVTKIYPGTGDQTVRALNDVSVEIRAGEIVALTGPSGCGKTTLLKLVGCIDFPTAGDVFIDDLKVSRLGDDKLTQLRRDRVGIVFQFFNLISGLNVSDNVALPLTLQRTGRGEIFVRVSEALDVVSMSHRAYAMPSQLSGGEAQRVAVARAIIHRPAVVLADEPTGNLDSHNAATVLSLLRGLADGGQAMLLATHSVETARWCDRTISMRDGRIVA
jgi:putative ABC transport system ATP-binding protein